MGIWGTQRIPIIVLSGEVNSGKTLFGLLIDPRTRTKDHPPTVRVYDQEGSAEAYTDALNFDWRDTREAVSRGVHRQILPSSPDDPKWRRLLLTQSDVNDSPSASLFRAWYIDLLKIEKGQFSTCICDTWTPLQEGMIEWLKMHPEAFGRTSTQYEKASSIFLWPDVKSMMSYVLATDCRLRFESFVLTVHLKNEWSGGANGTKTGQRIAEGLDVLDKLATLHLRLDRAAKAKGKEAPRVPSAIVVKERLVSFGLTADLDRPILPPRLPEATPDAIRQYIARGGADFGALEVGERMPDQSLTEDQVRLLDAQTAADKRAAAEASLETAKMSQSRMELMRGASVAAYGPGKTTTTTTSPPSHHTAVQPCSESQLKAMVVESKNVFSSGAEFAEWMRGKVGHDVPGRLSETEIMGLTSELARMAGDKKLEAAKKKLADSEAAQAARPAATEPAAPVAPLLITDAQLLVLRELSERCELTPLDMQRFLQSKGLSNHRELPRDVAEARIHQLNQIANRDEVPF